MILKQDVSNRKDTTPVIKMDKKDLYKLLHDKEEQFDRAKRKRAITTILALSVVIFAIMYSVQNPAGIWEITATFLVATILAGIDFVIHSVIIGQLFKRSRAESEALEYIRKSIKELEEDQQVK